MRLLTRVHWRAGGVKGFTGWWFGRSGKFRDEDLLAGEWGATNAASGRCALVVGAAANQLLLGCGSIEPQGSTSIICTTASTHLLRSCSLSGTTKSRSKRL